MRRGRTYVLGSRPYDGWAKIGRTSALNDASHRLRGCQTGNPRELAVRALWPEDLEAELHASYAEFRGRGEWFALPLAMIDTMADIALAERLIVHLAIEWPTERVWGMAPGCETAEDLARAFMEQVDHPNVVTLRANRTSPAHENVVEIGGWRNWHHLPD